MNNQCTGQLHDPDSQEEAVFNVGSDRLCYGCYEQHMLSLDDEDRRRNEVCD